MKRILKKYIAARTEQYIVRINRQKEDGYWEYGVDIDVDVPYEEGENFKDLHVKAEAIVRKMYPKCEIVRVCYA